MRQDVDDGDGSGSRAEMANVLSNEKRGQVLALGRLDWPLRRIEDAIGARRETASAYLKAGGIAVRSPGRWGRDRKPANEVSTDSTEAAQPANGVSSDAEPAAVATDGARE